MLYKALVRRSIEAETAVFTHPENIKKECQLHVVAKTLIDSKVDPNKFKMKNQAFHDP